MSKFRRQHHKSPALALSPQQAHVRAWEVAGKRPSLCPACHRHRPTLVVMSAGGTAGKWVCPRCLTKLRRRQPLAKLL
jgi:hypothetical protein